MKQDRYTLTYRANEASQVMNWIKAGQSGCLIGLRGAGKSNFLRFLLRQDVRQHYLRSDEVGFIFVFVDLLALAEQTEWAVYELILDRLLGQLRPLGLPAETIEEIASLQRETIHARDPFTTRRAIERSLTVLCQQPTQRIVLLFDEFDGVFRTLPPSLFRFLRAIRDSYKGQVSYIVVVTDDLDHLRDDLAEVEHFYRLVNRNVCGLGPYADADAQQMIHYLASQRSVAFSEADSARLIELSGGHAGLLKATLSLFWDTPQEGSLAGMASILKDEPVVQAECRKVWASMPESQQAALIALTVGAQIAPLMLRRLKRKGLVRESQSKSLLFSPIFADFVQQQTPPSTKDTIINRSPRQVQLEGRRIDNLSELEFEMLCYLYENQGRVCTKNELIENVFPQKFDDMAGGVSDAMLQKLISRLRGKIEPERGRPQYILTVQGEGYKFVKPKSTTTS